MKHIKSFISYVLRSFLAGLAVVGFCSSLSLAADFDFVQPAQESTSGGTVADAVEKGLDDPEHIERRGRIQVAANILALSRNLETGDTVNVNFFENKPYKITVQKRINDNFGNSTITGHAEGQVLQTFVMSVNADRFTISFQDLVTNMTYWISGETGPGLGTVLEVNDRNRPPRFE